MAKVEGVILSGARERSTEYLTALRGIAALLVFIAHCGGLGLRSLGWMGNNFVANSKFGVAMFFVVSAYCLCLVTAEYWNGSQVSWRAFYIRRAFRILPAYFTALAFYTLLSIWNANAPPDLALSLLSHITFANILDTKHAHDIFIEWTVVVEVAFYLLFPIFLWLARSIRWGMFGLALLLSWRSLRLYVIGSIGGEFADNAYFTLPFHIYAFIFGIAAFVATRRLHFNRWVAGSISVVSLAYLFWAMTQPDNTTNEVPITYAFTGLIIGCSNADSLLTRALCWKPLLCVGTISFSIYLSHFAIVTVFMPVGLANQWLALVMTLCVSTLVYWLIEGPAREFGRRRAKPTANREAVVNWLPRH